MEKYTNKETGRRMFSGFFRFALIGMLALFIWGLLAVFGVDVSLDEATAMVFVIGVPIIFLIYWMLFKYYDKNNP
jgi:hypothetical protein